MAGASRGLSHQPQPCSIHISRWINRTAKHWWRVDGKSANENTYRNAVVAAVGEPLDFTSQRGVSEVQKLIRLHDPAIHSVMPVSGVIAKGVQRISEQGTASNIICRLPWLRSKLLQSHSPTVPPRRTTASCSNGCPKHAHPSSMPFLEHAFHLF